MWTFKTGMQAPAPNPDGSKGVSPLGLSQAVGEGILSRAQALQNQVLTSSRMNWQAVYIKGGTTTRGMYYHSTPTASVNEQSSWYALGSLSADMTQVTILARSAKVTTPTPTTSLITQRWVDSDGVPLTYGINDSGIYYVGVSVAADAVQGGLGINLAAAIRTMTTYPPVLVAEATVDTSERTNVGNAQPVDVTTYSGGYRWQGVY